MKAGREEDVYDDEISHFDCTGGVWHWGDKGATSFLLYPDGDAIEIPFNEIERFCQMLKRLALTYRKEQEHEQE